MPITEPTFHIVELTDHQVISALRSHDLKQLPSSSPVRVLHVFATALRDGVPVSLSFPDFSPTWVLEPSAWDELCVDTWIGWSGPWQDAPSFVSDEFRSFETAEFLDLQEATTTPL